MMNSDPYSTPGLIFESVMAIIYLAIAYVFLFTHLFDNIFGSNDMLKTIFGVILGLYGLYRIYRVINRILISRRRRRRE